MSGDFENNGDHRGLPFLPIREEEEVHRRREEGAHMQQQELAVHILVVVHMLPAEEFLEGNLQVVRTEAGAARHITPEALGLHKQPAVRTLVARHRVVRKLQVLLLAGAGGHTVVAPRVGTLQQVVDHTPVVEDILVGVLVAHTEVEEQIHTEVGEQIHTEVEKQIHMELVPQAYHILLGVAQHGGQAVLEQASHTPQERMEHRTLLVQQDQC